MTLALGITDCILIAVNKNSFDFEYTCHGSLINALVKIYYGLFRYTFLDKSISILN